MQTVDFRQQSVDEKRLCVRRIMKTNLRRLAVLSEIGYHNTVVHVSLESSEKNASKLLL